MVTIGFNSDEYYPYFTESDYHPSLIIEVTEERAKEIRYLLAKMEELQEWLLKYDQESIEVSNATLKVSHCSGTVGGSNGFFQ